VKNNVEDKLEKSTEQEALRLEVAKKVAVGPPTKLQEVTSAWRNATYTTRASLGWTTGMLVVRETRSLPKGVQAEAA
jgi:hypothetical protein